MKTILALLILVTPLFAQRPLPVRHIPTPVHELYPQAVTLYRLAAHFDAEWKKNEASVIAGGDMLDPVVWAYLIGQRDANYQAAKKLRAAALRSEILHHDQLCLIKRPGDRDLVALPAHQLLK